MKDRIRKIRRELDLTQQEFADRLGVKRGAIANYEIGRNEPVDSVISLICREFSVNEEWLRTGVGAMFKTEPSDELDALAMRYNLKHKDYVLIEKLLKNAAYREALEDFCLEYAQDLLNGEADMDSEAFPSGTPDIDIDAEVEAYRRQLELQKKAMGGSSRLNGTGSIS